MYARVPQLGQLRGYRCVSVGVGDTVRGCGRLCGVARTHDRIIRVQKRISVAFLLALNAFKYKVKDIRLWLI